MANGILLLLVAGAFAGGFINGLAGFGTALLTLGIWLQIMPPEQAIAIVVFLSVLSGVQGLWSVRQSIRECTGRLARFLLPALPGIPLGIVSLAWIDVFYVKMTIVVFLLSYGLLFSLSRTLPTLPPATPVMDSIIGFAGGVLGGATSLSGALPTMWCAMKPWTKAQTRTVLQSYNFSILSLTMLILALRGAYSVSTMSMIAISLPITLLGTHFGVLVFRCLSDIQFRRLLVLLMLASGTLLALRELA